MVIAIKTMAIAPPVITHIFRGEFFLRWLARTRSLADLACSERSLAEDPCCFLLMLPLKFAKFFQMVFYCAGPTNMHAQQWPILLLVSIL